MEIYEKIKYYHEHTDYSQRKVAQILSVSRRNTGKDRPFHGNESPAAAGRTISLPMKSKPSYKYKRALYKIVMILHRAYIRFGHSWFADKISVVLNRFIFLPYG